MPLLEPAVGAVAAEVVGAAPPTYDEAEHRSVTASCPRREAAEAEVVVVVAWVVVASDQASWRMGEQVEDMTAGAFPTAQLAILAVMEVASPALAVMAA
jgi:hypothetical protein